MTLQNMNFGAQSAMALLARSWSVVWSSPVDNSDNSDERSGNDAAESPAARYANDPCRQSMLSVLEDQIIPRLVLAHPVLAKAAPVAPQSNATVAPADVQAMVELCLLEDRVKVAAMVSRLQAEGVSLETLFQELVAPAARELGTMWERDRIGFDQVTMGLVLLHEVVHSMGYEYQDGPQNAGAVQRIMLASAPGSQHVLGLCIVSEFFRKAGWQVALEVSPTERELRRAVQNEWFDLVGLSIALESQLSALPALVVGLKKASRNPRMRVMLGGRVFDHGKLQPDRFGADAICTDAREATALATDFLSQ